VQTKLAAQVVNGRWRLLQPLGEGADAVAWRAVDQRDGAPLALKVLKRLDAPAARDRFRLEFLALAEIAHPKLLGVFDLGVAEGLGPLQPGQLFFTARLLDGERPRAPLPAPALCQLVAEVASALDALHRRGLVHHDVKPDNLLVDQQGGVHLGDLGLAAARGASGDLRGTLSYLAPEALEGRGADPRLDLYALGATVWELWRGRPLHPAATVGELWRALQIPAPRLDDAPDGIANLVAHLLQPDPSRRPSSARAVAAEAVRLGARLEGVPLEPEPRPVPLRPVFVGRAAEKQSLLEALGRERVIIVEGEPGAGRTRLVEEARRSLQLAGAASGRPAPPWHGPSLPEAARTLGVDPPSGDVKAWIAGLCARLAEQPAVLHLDLDESRPPLELLELSLHGAAAPSVVVVEAPTGFALAGAFRVPLAPLGAAEVSLLVASMLGRAAEPLAAAVFRASGGEPRRCVELVRAASARAATPGPADVAALDGRDLAQLLLPALERLPPEGREVVEALAALGRPALTTELAGLARPLFSGLAAARAAGLVEEGDGRIRFPSTAHRVAAEASLGKQRRRDLHQLALEQLGQDLEDRARHQIALRHPEAAASALGAGVAARERCDLDRAEPLLEEALRLGAPRARLELARLRILRADYEGALIVLQPLEDEPEARLLSARALQRAGRSEEAEARLRRLLEATPSDEARALLARVLLARGLHQEALAAGGDGETRGLACFYLGRLDEAEAAFANIVAGGPAARARVASLLGMVAQARDDLPRAAAAYQEALALAREARDLHGAAIYAHNLGGTLRELGEYARALGPSSEAARNLGRLGKRLERSGALYNHGNLLLSLGDLDGATQAAEEALRLAGESGREAAYARLLEGDLARRRGRPAEALDLYQRATALLVDQGPYEQAVAALNRAEVLAELGRAEEAHAALAQGDNANLVDRHRLCEAKVALVLGGGFDPERLSPTWQRAARAGRRELAFRCALALGRAHLRAGAAALAFDWLKRAGEAWEEIRMRTPEMQREALDEDPDARKLRELLAATPAERRRSTVPGEPRPVDAARRLLSINKRLNSELRLPRLLELILDTVIDLTAAERGFILLADDQSKLQVSVARNLDQKALEGGEAAFSRSIAEQAAREGAPIVTVDAAGDSRFGAALSVSDLKLRSVLAVPLAVKGQTVGCVYVDHRLRAGAFGEADVQLVCDLAEQAAIAIDNARLHAENQAQAQKVAELARELEQKVASQALELGELHKEVRTSRAALSLRYNYDNLVGRTPRMLELFRLLDRVTETALPVVIYGESGTGKELVARAIHHNGPRRQHSFVGESCAAIPETLLEAALFGHVRGAFTGADAERRGLFEVAHGGTLFLDEVGEMSPAMQAKLLRVLQSGELRRLGGERTLKVDVRLLVASNRDLSRLVEEGRFREDLFYRLNVVRVGLPPLRERRDDIPLLVEHFLVKHARAAGGKPLKLQRAALQKLVGYRWPGNVRELENEILRAAALGGEVITVADLSPQVAAGDPEAAWESPDDLGLKKRVERLERTLLREALARADGNQTQAARLLGLSRFGLQKKLRRYGLEG
jgi:transcriptional regulator with GAF, ATPase, and Fis domain/tetratricopeptide (TPR) repeat protein